MDVCDAPIMVRTSNALGAYSEHINECKFMYVWNESNKSAKNNAFSQHQGDTYVLGI